MLSALLVLLNLKSLKSTFLLSFLVKVSAVGAFVVDFILSFFILGLLVLLPGFVDVSIFVAGLIRNDGFRFFLFCESVSESGVSYSLR